jgi:hypothetical protein
MGAVCVATEATPPPHAASVADRRRDNSAKDPRRLARIRRGKRKNTAVRKRLRPDGTLHAVA